MHQHLANLASDRSPSKSPTLSLWETTTRQALAGAREASAAAALAAYERALSIAHQLIEAPPAGRAEDCIAALVVSHHNLADWHIERSDPETAVCHLCDAHEALIALFLDTDRDSVVRQAALRHSRETHMALISHVARHGSHPLVTRALRKGCLALNIDSPRQH
ncbi:hypothetical protein PQQ51_28825 [Paraburkholderia xenovorans]|uniref:hypothetical protein n=1 Tax=Paraburkholderia xenovorans TaxID=36873 RepID=UPI0038BCDA48